MREWVANFLQDEQPLYEEAAFDDIYDDTIPRGDDALGEEFDDGVLETLLLVVLGAALVFLVYYRQQRQQAHRREEEARRQQEGGQALGQGAPRVGDGDRGVFPPPGDPDVANWLVGGIGN